MNIQDYLRTGWVIIDVQSSDYLDVLSKFKIMELEGNKITYKTEEFYRFWKSLELPEEDYDSVVKITFIIENDDLIVRYARLNSDDSDALKKILNF